MPVPGLLRRVRHLVLNPVERVRRKTPQVSKAILPPTKRMRSSRAKSARIGKSPAKAAVGKLKTRIRSGRIPSED
ncbi:MAG: hypothetical protein HYW50_05105 [Candidatus Diapherotrites archaeon]|nr:hypothetical protein [Candidatus Diapherotrites archaeon]